MSATVQLENPYATSRHSGESDTLLAGLGERFMAKVIDNMVVLATLIPGVGALLLVGGPEAAERDPVLLAVVVFGMMMSMAALFGTAILQWVWLATRGQSIGKRFIGIHIVKLDGSPVDFVSAVVLRAWAPGFVIGVANQLCLGWIIALVDIGPIFGAERRCVHDLIAGTKVAAGYPTHLLG